MRLVQAAAIILSTFSTYTFGVPLTIDIQGTITNIGAQPGSTDRFFELGDSISYTLRLDDNLLVSGAPGFGRDSNLVSNFRFRAGNYQVQGDGGRATIWNNVPDPFNFREPIDSFRLDHYYEPTWNALGQPDRDDFTLPIGSILGGSFPSQLTLDFQHPDVEFVDFGENLTDIANNIASQLEAIQTPSGGGDNPFTANGVLFFDDDTPGVNDLDLSFRIDEFTVNPVIVSDPIAFGIASAAVTKDRQFDNVNDSYRTSDSGPNLSTFAFAFSSVSGQGLTFGEITGPVFEEDQIGSPGIRVGANSSGAGSAGFSEARTFAFRSFQYNGEEALSLNINADLDGRFREAGFDLPNGKMQAGGGIYVFDAQEFAEALEWLGSDLEEIFFPFADKNTDQLDPSLVSILSASELLGLNPLAESTFSLIDGGTGSLFYDEVFLQIMASLNVEAGQQFTVLFDISTSSRVTCDGGGRCGSGFVVFGNTFASAEDFFTDSFGNPVSSISALRIPGGPNSVPIPSSILLLVFALGVFRTVRG